MGNRVTIYTDTPRPGLIEISDNAQTVTVAAAVHLDQSADPVRVLEVVRADGADEANAILWYVQQSIPAEGEAVASHVPTAQVYVNDTGPLTTEQLREAFDADVKAVRHEVQDRQALRPEAGGREEDDPDYIAFHRSVSLGEGYKLQATYSQGDRRAEVCLRDGYSPVVYDHAGEEVVGFYIAKPHDWTPLPSAEARRGHEVPAEVLAHYLTASGYTKTRVYDGPTTDTHAEFWATGKDDGNPKRKPLCVLTDESGPKRRTFVYLLELGQEVAR